MVETQGLSANMEDYLEAIYNVVQKNGAALPRDIGNILDVGRSSVSGALKTLRSKGLIRHESYGVITLTERGEVIAREVNRRHEALREFFVRILDIDEDLADTTACSLEHTVGDKVMARLVGFVQYSENCPAEVSEWLEGFDDYCEKYCKNEESFWSDNSSGSNSSLNQLEIDALEAAARDVPKTLRDVRPGEEVEITKVDLDGAVLSRLLDMGITKGSSVKVKKVAPLGDPIEIRIRGYNLTLRKDEAARIKVKPL